MKTVLLTFVTLIAIAFVGVLSHFALIEVGREVATLRTHRADGSTWETRLWIVDDAGSSYLHSGGDAWAKRFEGDPEVEVSRGSGPFRRYRAHPMPGAHPRIHELMREKYGIADRWVRFIAPDNDKTLAVRLEPLPDRPE